MRVRLGETRRASPSSEKVTHLTRRQIATIVWVSLGHSPTVREGASIQGDLKHRFFFNDITVFFQLSLQFTFTCVHILRADASPRRQEGSPPSTAPNRNYRMGYIGHPPCPRRRYSETTAQHTHTHTGKWCFETHFLELMHIYFIRLQFVNLLYRLPYL